ncbi:MAG: Ig-like domain-containing protein, partial [Dolichospermum sp.]
MKKKFNIQNWVMSLLMLVVSFVSSAQTPTTDLTTHQPTSVPGGANFEWHVGVLPSSALVSTPAAVSPGLYYGFYNYGSGCFSEAAPIRVITNSCPTTTVDLNIAVNAPPVGSTLSFHSGEIANDANEITGTAITAAGAGTYFVAYKTVVGGSNCYSQTSPIVVVVTPCCPTITNVSGNNVNPSTCGASDGSIKICGLVANSTANTINYDKNGTAATALTNQTADASGCIVISGLTAGTYTNIKVTNANCLSGSNTVSATLTDPTAPAAPTGASATPTSVCSGLPSILSGTCTTGTLTWYSDAALTTAVGGSTVNPAATTTYYGSCVSGTCQSPSVSVTVTVTPCANPDAPVATAGLPTTIPVLGNDKNPDGTPVTDLTKVTLPTVTTPTKGTATVNPDGTVTYTPNPGTSGTDSFVYTVCDKANPSVCDTATVTVT